MKKALIKLTGVLVTTAIALSGNGLVLANEVYNTGDEVVTATEETSKTPEDENAPAPADNPSNEETESNGNSSAQDKESGDNSDSSKPDAGKNGESQTEITITQEVNVDYANNNDELAESYINHVFGLDSSKTSTKKAAKRAYDPSAGFSAVNKYIYNNLKEHISKIAAGNETSTEISLSLSDYNFIYPISDPNNEAEVKSAAQAVVDESGMDFEAIFHALLNSCPYDLYWFDKTKKGSAACYYSFSFPVDSNNNLYIKVSGIKATFLVAEEYRDNGAEHVVSTTFSETVSYAHNNAISIVTANKDLDDYKKLEAYKNTICDLVEYNQPAADNKSTPYGNPWQLIWVFDGDVSTTVVCEGYSKAFQYLCDNTDFDSDDIYAVSVSGDVVLRSNTKIVTGPHMWNVVHMEDGKNYLVDVTNCDSDSGFLLFMKGYVGTLSNGYVVSNGRGQNNDYPYRNTSLAPALASSDYVYTPSPKPEPEEAPEFKITHGMALTDSVCVRFVVSFPDDFDTTNCYVTFNNTTSLTTKNTVYYADSTVREGNERYFTCEINALELSDYLTATLHYGDNKTITSDPYSAMDYIYSMKTKHPDNAKLVNLLNGLHAYGYYLQKSGWTDNKSHANIPDPAKFLSTADITSTVNSLKSYSFVKNLGNSGLDDDVKLGLTLNSKTEFRVSVKPASGVSITSTGYTTKEIDGSTYYQFTVGKIGPRALGTPRSFTITTTRGTATITVPAIYYVNNILTKDKYNTNQKLALVAYYNYYSAAMAYN